MSLSEETLHALMAYADGELADDEASRVEALIASSDEARAVAAAMVELGGHVRALLPSLPEVALVDAVMGRIDGSDVRARGDRRLEPARPAEPRPGARVTSLAERRARIAAGAMAVFAIAAGAMLFARSGSPRPGRPGQAAAPMAIASPIASAVGGADSRLATSSPGERADAPLDGAGGVQLEHLDAPSSDVSVFYVPAQEDDSNASNVVVWVGDDSSGH